MALIWFSFNYFLTIKKTEVVMRPACCIRSSENFVFWTEAVHRRDSTGASTYIHRDCTEASETTSASWRDRLCVFESSSYNSKVLPWLARIIIIIHCKHKNKLHRESEVYVRGFAMARAYSDHSSTLLVELTGVQLCTCIHYRTYTYIHTLRGYNRAHKHAIYFTYTFPIICIYIFPVPRYLFQPSLI